MKKKVYLTEIEEQNATTTFARNRALELLLSNGQFESPPVVEAVVKSYIETQIAINLVWSELKIRYNVPESVEKMDIKHVPGRLVWEEKEVKPEKDFTKLAGSIVDDIAKDILNRLRLQDYWIGLEQEVKGKIYRSWRAIIVDRLEREKNDNE